MSASCDAPVVLVIFNRPEGTRTVFDAIRRAKPKKLFLIADGPRAHKPEDADLCRKTRDVVSNVDWPCEVYRDFSEANLGCRRRIVSGLNWVFSLVETAIIFEDDCLPDDTFFPFCDELLVKYKDDLRIHAIAGSNLIAPHITTSDSYYFCKIGSYWGWATWRSRWVEFDENLKKWPVLRANHALEEVFDRKKDVKHWEHIFDTMYEGKGVSVSTWDYQWAFVGFFGNRMVLVPRVNLIKNVGFGAGATHTIETDSRNIIPVQAMEFPLKHPIALLGSRKLEHLRSDLNYATFSERVVRKLRKIKVGVAAKFRGNTAR